MFNQVESPGRLKYRLGERRRYIACGMIFDDYIILGVVWYSGLFFVWYGGVVMANPALYLEQKGVELGALESPTPLWWRLAFALFTLSDLLLLYLGVSGYWGEPYLWGALVAHLALTPRYVRRWILSRETRQAYYSKLSAKSDSSAVFTGLASIVVGLLVFYIYFSF